ncbi:hypothetical protein BDY17DRAFT_25060 [Neohortaea acidophila]|uniref:Uncharacterized protein n=1 Tax=Neohortaea acidophila TaxID=245834 RepID=A0A6A6Q849_9PEZI|nr:uncharacterized protein BDY17DRAFT_25060 [Neohortaea acidophila]KAF2488174.1 hypothetical protein BDY17DRAFT_25060 [Neohortaea acidophila]
MSGLDGLSVHCPEHTTRQASKDAREGICYEPTSSRPALRAHIHSISRRICLSIRRWRPRSQKQPLRRLLPHSQPVGRRGRVAWRRSNPQECREADRLTRSVSKQTPVPSCSHISETINACLAAIVAFRPATPAFQTPEAMAEDSFQRHDSSGDGEEENTPRSKRMHFRRACRLLHCPRPETSLKVHTLRGAARAQFGRRKEGPPCFNTSTVYIFHLIMFIRLFPVDFAGYPDVEEKRKVPADFL